MAFPPGDRGVPLSELRCPTCGGRFLHEPYQPEPEWTAAFEPQPWRAELLLQEPVSLLCQNHHRWTVKTLYRVGDGEDEVLLDRYLGTA